MSTRRGLAGCGIAAAALLLFGCAAGPDAGDWRLSPLTVNDSSAGDRDVTFVIWNISDDTAGGVWTESAGAWLGVAADGTITRFNDETRNGAPALDIAAINPTMLYVLRPLGSGQLNTTVELFDTATRVSEPVLTGQRVQTSPDPVLPFTADGTISVGAPMGPITSIDVDPAGRIVFVERVNLPRNASEHYVVRRLSRDGALETLAGMEPPLAGSTDTDDAITQPRDGEQLGGRAMTAATVDVAAGDPVGVVIGTEHGVFQIREDGTARVIDGALPADSPRRAAQDYGPGYRVRLVDAAENGAVVLPVSAAPAPAPMWLAGGSSRFRELLDGGTGWAAEPPAGLAVQDGTMRSSEALARTRNAVWVAPGVLVGILPGGADESALARITLP
ncbi:MAG TPA: hypothetical protein VIP54_06785 [Microterricola sp.]